MLPASYSSVPYSYHRPRKGDDSQSTITAMNMFNDECEIVAICQDVWQAWLLIRILNFAIRWR
jgi:hypothetical protein